MEKGIISEDGRHPYHRYSEIERVVQETPILHQYHRINYFSPLFIFSLELMGSSLKMFGKEFARSLIQTTTNPVVGLFIGILATSIIQYRHGVLIP